jgi:hypothetical protein
MEFNFFNLKDLAENFSLMVLLIFMIHDKVKAKIKNNQYKNLTVFLKKNEQIQQKLTELRVILNADRAKLFQFHNGDYYIGGDSALKCTLTNVSVSDGVSYPQQALTYYSSATVSSASQYINPAVEKEVGFFSLVENLKDDDWKRMKTLNGTKSILINKLGHGNNIIGFVIISWQQEVKEPTKEQLKMIQSVLDSLSLILKSEK